MTRTASGKTSPMKFVLRLLASLPLMGVAAFCLFGFLATFEPMPAMQQWIWRGIYSLAGLVSLLVIIWLWLGRARNSSSSRNS